LSNVNLFSRGRHYGLINFSNLVDDPRLNHITKIMKQKIAVLILMVAAAIFLSISLLSVNKSLKLRKHGVLTEGTVLERFGNKGLTTVTVSFETAEGTPVTAKAPKRHYVSKGDMVKIYYDPASPQKIDFGDTISYNMRGVVAGGLLFLIGFYYFIRFSVRDRAKRKLIRSGKKTAAEFVAVVRNEKYMMGNNNPWVIKCRWIDNLNNREYYFVSKDYTIDPGPYLNGRSHIDVFFDPDDPDRYYMDTSFMPKGNITIG
jgi:hypothetical protein